MEKTMWSTKAYYIYVALYRNKKYANPYSKSWLKAPNYSICRRKVITVQACPLIVLGIRQDLKMSLAEV